MRALHVSLLDGQTIVRWTGLEMALGGGEPVPDESAPGAQSQARTPIVWTHESIPFAQFASIDLHLANGTIYKLVSDLDDGTGIHGFFLLDAGKLGDAVEPYSEGIARAKSPSSRRDRRA